MDEFQRRLMGLQRRQDGPPPANPADVPFDPEVLADVTRGAVVYVGALKSMLDDRTYIRRKLHEVGRQHFPVRGMWHGPVSSSRCHFATNTLFVSYR